jgi:hypothetical protein
VTSAAEYAWVADERMDGFCVTAVTGVPLEEVVRRFGGDPATSMQATFAEAFNGVPGPTSILAGEVGDGVVVAENNGWQGVSDDVVARVARGGRLASYYRNVNAVMAFVHAVDGVVVAFFDPLLDGVPAALADAAAGLDFEGERVEPACFALLERLTGIQIDRAWLLDESHLVVGVPSPY